MSWDKDIFYRKFMDYIINLEQVPPQIWWVNIEP